MQAKAQAVPHVQDSSQPEQVGNAPVNIIRIIFSYLSDFQYIDSLSAFRFVTRFTPFQPPALRRASTGRTPPRPLSLLRRRLLGGDGADPAQGPRADVSLLAHRLRQQGRGVRGEAQEEGGGRSREGVRL